MTDPAPPMTDPAPVVPPPALPAQPVRPVQSQNYFRAIWGVTWLYFGVGALVGAGSPAVVSVLDSLTTLRILAVVFLFAGGLTLGSLFVERFQDRLTRVHGSLVGASLITDGAELAACVIGGLATVLVTVTTAARYEVTTPHVGALHVLFGASYPVGAEALVAVVALIRAVRLIRDPDYAANADGRP